MYGKFLQRFKTSYKNVQASVRSLRTSTQHPSKRKNDNESRDTKNRSGKAKLQSNALNLSSATRDAATTTESNTLLQVGEDSWRTLLNSRNYKNWLKVGLALRTACEYVSPIVELIAKDIHSSLIEKHGSSTSLRHFESKLFDNVLLERWIKDVFRLHRNPPSKAQLHRICDLTLWPTQDGLWEIAKVYMSNGYPTGGSFDASTFDATALFNFLKRCRVVEKYVDNFENVCRVLKARNNTMHSPRFGFTDEERDEQFDHILAMFQDTSLRFHVDQSLDTSALLRNVMEIKMADLTVTATARSTLGIIDDRILDSDPGLTPSAKKTSLLSLKDVASKILSPSICCTTANRNLVDSHQRTLTKSRSVQHKLHQRTSNASRFGNHSSEAYYLKTTQIKALSNTPPQIIFRSKSETNVTEIIGGNNVWRAIYLANNPFMNTNKSIRRYHSDRSCNGAFLPCGKRKRDDEMDDVASCSSSKRRKTNECSPKFNVDEKRRKAPSGGGGGGTQYKDMLHNFLLSQKENSGGEYFDKKDKQGKFHAMVDFVSNFAIIGRHPKETIKEAEQESASMALEWLGLKRTEKKDAKLMLDIFCKAVPKKLPSYKSYKVSTKPYFTLLQVLNHNTMYYIEHLSQHELFLQVTCNVQGCSKEDAELIAARTALEDACINVEAITDLKGALNEYCLQNGATLPVYRNENWFDVKTNIKYQDSTVTSFLRKYLLQSTLNSDEFIESEMENECEAHTASQHDLIEATSGLPCRSRMKSEESAARAVLEKLGFDVSLCTDRSYKSTLKDHCLQWDFCPVYHSFQIKPVVEYPQQYECVVASPCLHSTNQEFTVVSDDCGFSTAREAKESAARNALSLLGQLS